MARLGWNLDSGLARAVSIALMAAVVPGLAAVPFCFLSGRTWRTVRLVAGLAVLSGWGGWCLWQRSNLGAAPVALAGVGMLLLVACGLDAHGQSSGDDVHVGRGPAEGP
jgi:hypothetical protein